MPIEPLEIRDPVTGELLTTLAQARPAGADLGASAPECRHDTIAESAGVAVCLDCGAPHPKRGGRGD